jgi:hypothetical protein
LLAIIERYSRIKKRKVFSELKKRCLVWEGKQKGREVSRPPFVLFASAFLFDLFDLCQVFFFRKNPVVVLSASALQSLFFALFRFP